MTKKLEIYKCEICGNLIEVEFAGVGELVCCGQPMTLQVENTVEASKEKHIPVIREMEEGIMVEVGSIPHPMETAHYIQWIEVITDKKTYREFLKPGDNPACFFPITNDAFTARAYCNLHGLWKNS